ncbi:exopolyphosphatase [Nocardioides sp.]|uniref:Ppx/GppA phosphatase family protein n=1 Tax=Nocardioides sp. TaxID=35761 RepID=UPI003512620E
MGTTPVAAIDCGTNTIKLLVGDLAGAPDEVLRTSRMVRLGQGVDATGRLAPEALARTFAAVEEFAGLIAAAGVPVERVRFCATSASRDAENAAEFVDGVRARLGVAPEVLSGREEAALAFDGAVRGLAGVADLDGRVLVVDVGGGSTELILGEASTGPIAAHSMDIGSVRLHERHVRTDPPSAAEIAAITADIDAALDAATREVDASSADRLVAVAGTHTTLAAGILGLEAFDRERIHGARLAAADVETLVQGLLAMTVAERRALPWMHPGRADVIDAGALIAGRVIARSRCSAITVSGSDILDGIAWSLLAR